MIFKFGKNISQAITTNNKQFEERNNLSHFTTFGQQYRFCCTQFHVPQVNIQTVKVLIPDVVCKEYEINL